MNPKGAVKNYFNKNNSYVNSKFADFAPLWQLSGLAGSVAGGLKGGLEQDSEGRQIGAGERLMRVGTNALAGGVLGGAVGAGIPQLMKESNAAKQIGNAVNNATGINADPTQLPIGLKESIAAKRAAKLRIQRPPSAASRLARNAKDVISQGIEDTQEFVINPLQNTANKIKAIPKQLQESYENYTLSPIQKAAKDTARQIAEEEAQSLASSAARAGINRNVTDLNVAEDAIKKANEISEQLSIAPVQRVQGATVGAGIGGTLGALAGAPLGPVGVGVGAHLGGVTGAAIGKKDGIKKVSQNINNVVGGTVNKAKELQQELVNPNSDIRQKGRNAWRGVLKADRAGKDWLNSKIGTNFAYNSYPTNFGFNLGNKETNPYMTGAKAGLLGGSVVGGITGLVQGINQGVESDQKQLDQIQAIPDPYARKQEWDVYDNDYSRAGRAIGNTANTLGQATLNAGIGAVGGALLGGAGLTAYNNVKNKKFTLTGQPRISRGQALKVLITGNQ